MMNKNNNNGKILLIIFIISATLLSAAQSVITTALAPIMEDLNITSTMVQWLYSSFLLVLGVMIPTTAFIAKRFRIKYILVVSLAIFTIASFIAFIAPNFEILLLGRILQGIGCGILLPITQIVIFKIIPKEKWQIYMGLFGFIIGVAPALAPTLGGIIIDSSGWRNIFLVFGIISLILVIGSIILVKYEFEISDYSLDFFSLILCIVGCTGLLVGFSNISGNGLDFVHVILPIIIGIICLAVFTHRQKLLEHPLLRMDIMKNKLFVWGTLFSAILYFTMCGLNVILPLFVQNVNLQSATISGLVLLPATIVMIIFNFLGPLLATKLGVKKVLILSSILSIFGFGIMMTYTPETNIEFIIVTQIIRAMGAGLGLMPAVTWTIGLIHEHVEDATAINNTVRQIIGSIGAALAVVLMTIFAGGNIGPNQVSVYAFAETSFVMVILCIISLLITILFIKDYDTKTN